LSAVELGVAAADDALTRAGIATDDVDEVIFGHARQAGAGPNPARQVSIGAGVAESTPAFTVNQACASGLKAVMLAAQTVALGGAEVILAGGIESMSNTPYLLPKARFGYRMGNAKVVDGMYRDGFMCPLCGDLMGATAERLAEKYQISRKAQDDYAVETHRRAQAAKVAGRFLDEIVPVEVPSRKGASVVVSTDQHPRENLTAKHMANLPPVFRENGTVHAGNSSGVTDGGAAVLVMSEEAAGRHGVNVMAHVIAATQAGVAPSIMGMGPVPSMRELMELLEIRIADIDLIELNEAFAAQVLAVDQELQLDQEKLNVNGGAIALGHPIGCTGTRILVTLLHEMVRRSAKRGVATLCVSGGMGSSLLVERL
jgi:acetyl-CoA C-acetyltransferase